MTCFIVNIPVERGTLIVVSHDYVKMSGEKGQPKTEDLLLNYPIGCRMQPELRLGTHLTRQMSQERQRV